MSKSEKLPGSLSLRRYRLDEVLSSGGMGVLYRATHLHTGRKVALKYLHGAAERVGTERFALEARAAATLKHPNVVDVIDMDTDEQGVACLVLELLEGKSLATVLEEQGRLSAEQCAAWLLPIMGALALLHDRGILHRDLKPANIFIATGPDGNTTPKLLDFGVAKLPSQPSLTATGAILGTPSYMSPEQARGERELLAGSDVWAMGVIWFRCLTGRLPFEHESVMGTLMRIVNERAPRVESVFSEVPRALGWAIDRALQHDPGARYSDMRTFARTILSAGLKDNLTLPIAPDPLGLPDWSTWLTDERNLTSTSSMPAVMPSSGWSKAPPQVPMSSFTSQAVAARTGESAAPEVPAASEQESAKLNLDSRPHRTVSPTRWLSAILVASLLALLASRWLRVEPSPESKLPAARLETRPVSPEAPPTVPSVQSTAKSTTPTEPASVTQPSGVSRALQDDEF